MNTISNSATSGAAVLGASMSYDSLLEIENQLHNDPKLGKIRCNGHRPNKTNLVKMALLYFQRANISEERLLSLFETSNDDELFLANLKEARRFE